VQTLQVQLHTAVPAKTRLLLQQHLLLPTDKEEGEVGDVDGDDSDSDEKSEDENEEDEHEEVVVGMGKCNNAMHAVEEHDHVGNDRNEQDTEDKYKDEQTSRRHCGFGAPLNTYIRRH
jgi:hypothetical protein